MKFDRGRTRPMIKKVVAKLEKQKREDKNKPKRARVAPHKYELMFGNGRVKW